MTPFARAAAFVLRWEGEWSDDPGDAGGRTRWGISSRAHPGIDLDTLTREQAIEVHEVDYWRRAHCGDFPWPLSLALFDGTVQHGVIPAVRFLQWALHVTVDGVPGPETIEAARRAPAGDVLTDYLAQRAVLYATLAEAFRYGWFRRLFALEREALRP